MPAGTSFEEFCRAARGKFHGIEPAYSPEDPPYAAGSEKEFIKMRNIITDNGLELYSLAGGFYWDKCFTSDDKNQVGEALMLARRHIDAAAALGAPVILLVPGNCNKINGGHVRYDDALKRAEEAMHILAPYAQERNVIIGAENVWNRFLLSPIEMRDFIDRINSPFVQAYFDIGNVLIQSWPEDWIRILGRRICAVHIKDYSFQKQFVPLLEGNADFGACMAALREAGYNGALTAEIGAPENWSAEQCAHRISQDLNTILSM